MLYFRRVPHTRLITRHKSSIEEIVADNLLGRFRGPNEDRTFQRGNANAIPGNRFGC